MGQQNIPFIHLSIHPFMYQSIYLSINPFIYLSIHLSIHLTWGSVTSLVNSSNSLSILSVNMMCLGVILTRCSFLKENILWWCPSKWKLSTERSQGMVQPNTGFVRAVLGRLLYNLFWAVLGTFLKLILKQMVWKKDVPKTPFYAPKSKTILGN